MKNIFWSLIAGSSILATGLMVMRPDIIIGGIANATPAPKVLVCKYVGTPGVDERLQTGQNPISVSENAIKDFHGVNSYFNDKQGRSYVLDIDNGQEVDESACPTTTVTPPTPPVATPPVTNNPPTIPETQNSGK